MIVAQDVSPAWKELRYHSKQSQLYRSNARFVAVAAGRGSGKTEIARRRIVRYLCVRKPWSDPMYAFILPTLPQAKRVAWKPLKALVPPRWIRKINESDMTIETIFGSTLHVLSADRPQRIEGVQWDGAVVDESSDQRPDLFSKTLLPALSHRQGWCWRIGVPKRYGIGAADFKEFFDKGADESYTWPSDDILSPEELELHRNLLDERDYNEQYRASWENAKGAMFYAFDEVLNVTDQLTYNPLAPIEVGSDFNVDPMAWVIAQRMNIGGYDSLFVFDEVFLRNTNTESTLAYLWAKYGKSHKSGWLFFGDAAARQRKTSATMSDYLIIKNHPMFKQAGAQIYYPQANPLIRDRIAACNALLKNAAGVRRCFIHPRCKNLIQDLKQRAWKPGSMEPDDYGDVGHITDALGYIIHRRWPVAMPKTESKPEVIIRG